MASAFTVQFRLGKCAGARDDSKLAGYIDQLVSPNVRLLLDCIRLTMRFGDTSEHIADQRDGRALALAHDVRIHPKRCGGIGVPKN